MSADIALLTGGTGAIGRHLVPLLARHSEVFVLTRDPVLASARLRVAVGQPLRFVRGDITEAGLGLAPADVTTLRERVTHLIHCAAETRFAAPLEHARAINVEGTGRVLAFAAGLRRLRAVACASTAYVAGTRTGVILETDHEGDGWANSYEQSKHEMEALARDAMMRLPVSVYRSSTVIGHSTTGVVDGFNAIHHALRLFYQGLVPMVPGQPDTQVDFVPVDFVARAMHHLVTRAFVPGSTYHLCAGARGSATLGELLDETVRVFERVRPAWRKRRIVRPAIVDADTYSLFSRSVEESGNAVLRGAIRAVDAFVWQLTYPKTFDTRTADAALANSGIATPRVADFYDRVVAHCVTSNWGQAAVVDAVAPSPAGAAP